LLDQGQHAAVVDAWLKRSAKDASAVVLLRLFEAAFAKLWTETKSTLGEVTLTAIAGRVVYNAAERFSLFSSLKVDPASGIQVDELREQLASLRDSDLRDGLRFVLVEFLTVLGNLTAEILTPELHAKLARVVLPKATDDGGSKNP
jgi:hypothetical protein